MYNYVFVYGTLKRGYGNSYLLDDSDFVQEAMTSPEYTMRSLGGFPGVQLNGNTPIHGEVWRVNKKTMDRLDQLEGYPRFYDRKQIDLRGCNYMPWMYFLPEQEYLTYPVIEDGVWRGYAHHANENHSQ